MMVKNQFAPFKKAGTLLFASTLLFACATASSQVPNNASEITSPKIQWPISVGGLQFEIASSGQPFDEVPDGSLVRLTANVGESGDYQVYGEYETTQIPFYFDEKRKVYEGLFGVPYGTKPGVIYIILHVKKNGPDKNAIDQVQKLPLTVVDGKYAAEQLSVDPSKVHPSAKDLAIIQKERVEVGKIYSRLTPKKYWKGPFKFPMPSKLTSQFGTKRIFNGDFSSFHSGLDFKAKVGSRVYSAEAGIVVWTKSLFYTGKTVMIDHGYGVISLYAHLSRVKVKKGQVVKKGQLIALSGKTGRVSGPHLHWQAVVNKTKINPMDLTKVLR